jgi:hypothetical protein
MRKLPALIVMVCLCLGPALAANAADPAAEQKAKLTQAQRYWEAADMEQVIGDFLQKVAGSAPEERRAQILADAKEVQQSGSIKEQVQKTMVETFTLDELKALADFYSSPEGQSVMKKMRPFMGQVTQIVVEELRAKVNPAAGAAPGGKPAAPKQ